jgi:hypothetical protein
MGMHQAQKNKFKCINIKQLRALLERIPWMKAKNSVLIMAETERLYFESTYSRQV